MTVHNIYFILVACLVTSNTNCDVTELRVTEKGHIIINLGENCSARGALEAVGIKQESYPFDSCIVPMSALTLCLRDDFRDYTNPDYFVPYFDKHSPINKYGIVLAHSFPLVCIGQKENGEDLLVMDPEWRKVLPSIQEKYARRTSRFRRACSSGKTVIFFRYLDVNYKTAATLSQLLHSCYPDLNFLILCVQNSTTPQQEDRWNLPNVRNFFYNVNSPSAYEEWIRIFKKAEVLD